MKKKPLSLTNPYLKNARLREKMFYISAETSTEIENMHPALPKKNKPKVFKRSSTPGNA